MRGVPFYFFMCLLLGSGSWVMGQSVPVGQDEFLRDLQLEGKIDSSFSFCARPLFYGAGLRRDEFSYASFGKSKGSISMLPVLVNTKFNSHHPYGWNDGGMISAKGFQASFSAGVYAAFGPFSIQLQPELVYAANPGFEHNSSYGADTRGAYKKIFPGQSSIRLNMGAVSLGVSTENLWWGPGIYNSLLMTNNAPGFVHLTFNTTRPVKTAIGSFEWQFISGKLYEDTSLLLENKNLTTSYYNPKSYDGSGYSGFYDPAQKWRYLNAISITYQPKWVKGLFLGLNRVAYAYNDNLHKGDPNFFKSYLPTIFGVFRETYIYAGNLPAASKRYKQMLSLHGRLVFTKSHAEIYGEYGWGDNQYNLRDFVINMSHSAAYIAGFKKLFPLATSNKWFDIQAELTQLSQGNGYLIRSAGNWYGYQGGYTNQNQLLGAGIGMGNNVQTLAGTWISGWKKLGMKLERLRHDPLYHAVYWTDLSVGFLGQWRFNQFLLNAQLQFIRSKNYAWEEGKNRFNLFNTIGVSYQF